jgi:hypothetical protein
MKFHGPFRSFFLKILLLLVCATFCSVAQAQDVFAQTMFVVAAPVPNAPTPLLAASPAIAVTPVAVTTVPSYENSRHKFWDRENGWLFLAAAISNGADFAVTRANLQSGGRELNPVVRMFGTSSSGLAMNFVGETTSIMSLSYFFHKTGHHKLERLAPVMNIGSSAGAVTFGLMHR